jgi:GT2 family glycosyltransferase
VTFSRTSAQCLDQDTPVAVAPVDVSVVICAFAEERWPDLKAAVESVFAQSPPVKEIVVVIDHNPALFKRALESLSGVRVLENTAGRGAGEARNTGVSATTGAILGFLDDDATAVSGWIGHAIDAFADPQVMGVGGTIEPAWDREPPRWFPQEFNWTVGCTYPGLPNAPAPVRNLIAANMFVRRSVFDELGGFRAGFGKKETQSRPEETDLCLRANQRWPARMWLYDPAVAVRHRVPATRGRPRYFISRCYNEGLGKAALVGYLGSGDGLAAERAYTRRTLPAGIAEGLRVTIAERDLAGIARSASIVVGLAATVTGYLLGKMTVSRAQT